MTQTEICISALASQKEWRDVAHLAQLVDHVNWLAPEELAAAAHPAVVCALEAHSAPNSFAALIKQRAAAGLTTILVPRFKAGNLAKALGAPTTVHIKGGEAGHLSWEDSTSYDLPVFAVIETPMTAKRWASTDKGCCIMAWRSDTTKGPVVLCTASVAGPALGADLETQKRLLAQMIDNATDLQPSGTIASSADETASVVDADSFLATEGADAAAVLLALYAARGNKDADLAHVAENRLGMRLSPALMQYADTLADEDPDAIAKALIRHGWRAHLRRLDLLLQEDENS